MIKLIYDECNPTRDRRPTTAEDVKNDIHVEEYDSIPEMIGDFVSEGYEEFAEDEGIDPNNEMEVLEAWLGYYNDPGDGSPNIQYISIDGVPYESNNVLTYDCLLDKDLENASEQDIKNEIIQAYDDYGIDYDDFYEEDDMDESLNEASEGNYEINYSCWIDQEGTFGLDGDFDTEEEAIEFCKENNYYSVEKQYFDENERVKTEEIFINPDYVDSDEIADDYINNDEYIDDDKEEIESETWYKGIDDEGDTDFVVDEEVFEDNDDYVNEKLNYVISRKIRIIKMEDPIDNKRYAGKEGIIQSIETDGFGDTQYWGTWGNVAVYPDYDKIEFIDNESLEEGLFDAEEENVNYGHKAWVLNEIISSMNNEGAYYESGWLYIWPDGETEEECDGDFGDYDSFKDLEDEFISIYTYHDDEDEESNYHDDGLYNPTKEAVEVAHEYDKKLGLEPIQVLGNVKESLNEDENAATTTEENSNQDYNISIELNTDDDDYDISYSAGEIDYLSAVKINLEKDNSKGYIMISYNANFKFEHDWHGGYAMATRWDPPESPDLDVRLQPLKLEDIVIYPEDNLDSDGELPDNIEGYLKSIEPKLRELIFEKSEDIYKIVDKYIDDNWEEFYDRLEETDNEEPDYDDEPPYYD